ncbi:MAG: adenosine deaminase [Bacteroidaceae bacterium]|nr:adenosine deaminase [Bacteroidaceae bacterium]
MKKRWHVILSLCCMLAFAACSSDDDVNLPQEDSKSLAERYALVDLHLHLDGSLSMEDVRYMAGIEDVTLPQDSAELARLLTCPVDCEDLNDYLTCFDLPVSVMQSRTTIAYSVSSLVRRLDAQGLVYAEICYAPQLHLQKGLTQDEVVAASVAGLREGLAACRNGFKANLILCCMRGDGNDELNRETLRMAKKYLGQGVVAADLAGAEALFPTANYRETFAYANELGVPFTIHAGEADGVESMQLAMDYGTRRIGHGIRSWNDAATRSRVKEQGICLSLCPTSNLQTKALDGVSRMAQFPLRVFLDEGIPVCINTDNMTVSGTTLRHEFQQLFDAGLLSADEAEHIVETAIRHTFVSEAEQEELLATARERMNK